MLYLSNSRWKRAFALVLFTLLAAGLLLLQPPVPQDPVYHRFADTRVLLGIPNFYNVASNLFFVIIGIWGFRLLAVKKMDLRTRWIYGCLFAGILLTGVGSAYYHYAPANDPLVYDRIPMTIIFMSFLAVTIAGYISVAAGFRLLIPFLLIGAGSVLWWHYTESTGQGDLRLYFFMQFYPVILVPLIYLLYPRLHGKSNWWLLLLIILFYAVAKLCEHYDKELFDRIGFSGHSIKHILAAGSTVCFVQMFARETPAGFVK